MGACLKRKSAEYIADDDAGRLKGNGADWAYVYVVCFCVALWLVSISRYRSHRYMFRSLKES